jgi:hypothetical protein
MVGSKYFRTAGSHYDNYIVFACFFLQFVSIVVYYKLNFIFVFSVFIGP